jgi:hypothetical protein
VGKSTVAALASEILHDRGIRHGLLEVDALEGVYPPPDPADPYSTDLAMKNLATVWPNFLGAGITRAIVTMTLENDAERDALLAAMGDPVATIVRLEASQEAREDRIRRREFGELRELFLNKTGPLAEQMRCLDIGDVVLYNEEEPRLVATRLLEELGWI